MTPTWDEFVLADANRRREIIRAWRLNPPNDLRILQYLLRDEEMTNDAQWDHEMYGATGLDGWQ